MSSPLNFANDFLGKMIGDKINNICYETKYPALLCSGKKPEQNHAGNQSLIAKKGNYPDNHIGNTGCNN